MSGDEVQALLLTVQGLDGRPLDRVVFDAWYPILADFDYNDAVQAVREHAKNRRERVTPADIVAGVREIRRTRAVDRDRALSQGRFAKEPVAQPPWMADAEDAAHRAKLACLKRGYSHGHPITVRSCNTAAFEVQRAWEAEHGQWTTPAPAFATVPMPADEDAEVANVLADVFGGGLP